MQIYPDSISCFREASPSMETGLRCHSMRAKHLHAIQPTPLNIKQNCPKRIRIQIRYKHRAEPSCANVVEISLDKQQVGPRVKQSAASPVPVLVNVQDNNEKTRQPIHRRQYTRHGP